MQGLQSRSPTVWIRRAPKESLLSGVGPLGERAPSFASEITARTETVSLSKATVRQTTEKKARERDVRLRRPVILLGAPGAGKGTQARMICSKFGVPHIATGNIFREHVKHGTPLGVLASKFLDEGTLIPDDVVNEMIRERLTEPDCGDGFVLDGYPRTFLQALEFKTILREIGQKPPVVVSLRVRHDVLTERLSGRWTCPACERTYTLKKRRPRQQMLCEIDGCMLEQRADDREDTIRARLAAYERHCSQLTDFYQRHSHRVVEVNGEQSPETISRELLKELFR